MMDFPTWFYWMLLFVQYGWWTIPATIAVIVGAAVMAWRKWGRA